MVNMPTQKAQDLIKAIMQKDGAKYMRDTKEREREGKALRRTRVRAG